VSTEDKTQYSDFAEDFNTIPYLKNFQRIKELPTKTQKLVVDFLVSK